MTLLWENEEAVYDDFNDLIEAVDANSVNPLNVTIEINEDTVIAYRPAPDYPVEENTVSDNGDIQWLVEEDMAPSYVLQKLLSRRGFKTKHHNL